MANNNKETTITVYGRLSWPVWTHAEAVARNAKGDYPTTPDKVAPEFNLLLDQAQYDKFVKHVKDVFLPYCVAQHKAGEKRNALDERMVKRILDVIDDPESQPPYIPIKPVPEKTVDLAPEAVCMLKIKGMNGVDLTQKAIVQDENELAVPDPDILKFPLVMPIQRTVHKMYGGCYVAATINLYAYVSGKNLPGFSASSSVAIFKADAERFGGSIEIDEDEIFLD